MRPSSPKVEALHPDDLLEQAWHIEAIAQALNEVFQGHDRKVLITLPPRHLKTICCTSFCAWALGKDPSLRYLSASYGDRLARDQMRDFRTIVQSPFYRRIFPHMRENRRDTELEFITSQNGGRRAVSRGGAVTGFGADIIIVDDIMKADDCQSPSERQQVKNFYETTLYSRLNDKRTGRIIVVQQRLHEDDLPGYLLEKGGFTHVNLPAIAPTEQTDALTYGRTKTMQPGDVLCPQRESREQLGAMRVDMGSANFAAQHLQDPAAGHADGFSWSSIRTYDQAPEASECELVVQSWDTAPKITENNDYSACSTWGRHDGAWKLLIAKL